MQPVVEKLLLIDGSNLLFQMFFGMPARIVNRNGKAIHGALGFVGALNKIIRMTKPTHVAVLFDGEHENERAEIDADYKANRVDYSQVDESESPFSQIDDVYRCLDILGIRHAETTVCETDDWIAGYTLKYGMGSEIVISSFDSDYFQLITENVSVLRYRGVNTAIFTPEVIRTKFGIQPEQYADFKALVGDASDNIKGAEKVGPKTAAALLAQFGTLEGVLTRAEQISKPHIRESILKSAEKLRANYRIIKLSEGAKLPFASEELVYRDSNMTTNDVLTRAELIP